MTIQMMIALAITVVMIVLVMIEKNSLWSGAIICLFVASHFWYYGY